MAITWNVKIAVLNIERREISVIATRTDDEAPENPQISTYRINWTEIATQEQKVNVIDEIWAMHEEKLAYDALTNGIVDDLESQAEQALQNKEGA